MGSHSNQRPPRHKAIHDRGRVHALAVWRRFANASADGGRPSAGRRGYDRDWRELRADHLRREPYCRLCAQRGVTQPARIVDHILAIAERPDLRLVDSNLQSLCVPCANRKTNRYDGGMGSKRKPWRT